MVIFENQPRITYAKGNNTNFDLKFPILGVAYHISDIYLEELGKHGESLKPIRACMMLQPFYTEMAISKK